MNQPTVSINSPSRHYLPFWLLAGFSILFVLPSARLWLQRPLQLIEFEFEYFLGLFADYDADTQLAVIAADRLIHFTGFLFIGMLYALCVESVRRHGHLYSWRFLILFSILLWAAFTLAMPWVSPDVFFYIGMGWLDSHYGLSPYLHSMSAVPGLSTEEMFQNVYPGFLYGPTSYGPLFQWVAKWLATLSGGNEILALALHKALYLAVHVASCFLLIRLVPSASAKWAFIFFACNPLILFSILACAHNDHLMTFFVLAAFALRQTRRYFLCGVALGAAFSIKYIPILLLPLFFLDLILGKSTLFPLSRRIGQGLTLSGGFLLAVLALYGLYPEGALQFLRVVGYDHWLQDAGGGGGGGIGVYRNSIYHLLLTLRYADMKLVFLSAYTLLLAWLIMGVRSNNPFPLAGASLACYLLYFLLLNQTNQEWYLTWIMPILPLIGTQEARRFGYQLSAIFLPIIIFTVKDPPIVVLVANVMGYMVILYFSIILLLRSISTRRSATAPM
jgi:hypothetical protein